MACADWSTELNAAVLVASRKYQLVDESSRQVQVDIFSPIQENEIEWSCRIAITGLDIQSEHVVRHADSYGTLRRAFYYAQKVLEPFGDRLLLKHMPKGWLEFDMVLVHDILGASFRENIRKLVEDALKQQADAREEFRAEFMKSWENRASRNRTDE